MNYYNSKEAKIEDLIGKTLLKIEIVEDDYNNQEIHFITSRDEHYIMFHIQECYENVYIESINGDIIKLIGAEILIAEEVSNDKFIEKWKNKFTKNKYEMLENDKNEYFPDSYLWTFYKLSTINGDVTIRWFGKSNGYYSESVDFILLDKEITN